MHARSHRQTRPRRRTLRGATAVITFAMGAVLLPVTVAHADPPPTVPGTPAPVGTAAGNRAIAVFYGAPASDGGSPILGYQTVCAPPDTLVPRQPVWASVTPPQLAIEVGGLINDLTYTCYVRAFNELGPGPFSAGATGRPTAPDHGFVDVPPGAFFDRPIAWLAAAGITTGVGGGTTFEPFRDVTRGELATFIHRLAGSPAVTGTSGFADVPDGAFYSRAVTWLRRNRLTTGVGGSNFFLPDAPVTRAEMAAFIHRLAGSPAVTGTSGFADVPDGAFYTSAVTWLRQNGITTGVGGTNLYAPDNPVTRGEMATFIHRLGTL